MAQVDPGIAQGVPDMAQVPQSMAQEVAVKRTSGYSGYSTRLDISAQVVTEMEQVVQVIARYVVSAIAHVVPGMAHVVASIEKMCCTEV
jgi:hypothetical protein